MLRYFLPIAILCLLSPVLRGQTLTLDASHRMRYVTWDGGVSGAEGSGVQFTRNRTRLGLTWRPASSLEFRAALVNEFFHWMQSPVDRPTKLDEIAFEHLYAKWSDTVGIPLSATVGRQNLRLGDGFLVMDGTPLDGSRTLYVNAVRLDVLPFPGHRLTLFALDQPEKDDLLPIVNDSRRTLAEYDRALVGGGYSMTHDGTSAEISLLGGSGGYKSFMETARPEFVSCRSLTASALLRQAVPGGGRATGELAWQTVALDEHGADHGSFDGWAWRAELSWALPEAMAVPIELSAGAFHYPTLWEPLLGRWPMWNESMVFTRHILPAPGYWQNLEAALFGASARPLPSLRVNVGLQFLCPVTGPLGIVSERTPSSVGRLLTLHVFWQPELPVSAHFMFERMWYDDSFVAARWSGMPDGYMWGRVEVMYVLPAVALD